MIYSNFRPWGPLPWLLNHFPDEKWNFLGSIATGDRSLSSWRTLSSKRALESELMLNIKDSASAYWGEEHLKRLEERRTEYLSDGGGSDNIVDCHILDNWDEIRLVVTKFLSTNPNNIIVDISTLPKRFFFPIIREIIEKSKAQTIIATYTKPLSYDKAKPLAVDPEPWRSISGFHETYPERFKKKLIVGLGYEPLGLPQILKEGSFSSESIHLLFPFPASPAGYSRNWEFVRNLDTEVGPYELDPVRVNGYDLPAIFDIIHKITDNGNDYAVFAPYGTKPMSLAMCLYATYHHRKTAVYYTQPRSYNPRYSTGVSELNGEPETYAYLIRSKGECLYR